MPVTKNLLSLLPNDTNTVKCVYFEQIVHTRSEFWSIHVKVYMFLAIYGSFSHSVNMLIDMHTTGIIKSNNTSS